MEWTDEFRDEMRQRQLARFRYTLIALLVGTFIMVLIAGYDRLASGIWDDTFLIMLGTAALPIPFVTAFRYLLRYDFLVRPIALLALGLDIIILPFIVYLFGMFNNGATLFFPAIVVLYSVYINSRFATRLFFGNQIVFIALGLLAFNGIIPYAPAYIRDAEAYKAVYLPFLNNLTLFDFIIGHLILFVIVGFTLIATNLVVSKMKQRARELTVSNKKISILTNKLKVFLPRQFVKSLESGDKDSVPDYERRKLTIFFSDVKGFTAWTDKLEPEETRELLNQYLSEMSKIALKWGGTIDKFIGDQIMIFFGAPEFTSDRDHAIRCAKMAIEMQEKMKELRAGWEDLGFDEPLHIRIGISTGYATVGVFGSEDRLNYTILGSAVNLASRLEIACKQDCITISHVTYSLIKDEIECEPKGTIEVKGFNEPVKIYEIKGSKT